MSKHAIYFHQAEYSIKKSISIPSSIPEFHGICIPLPKANVSICTSRDHISQGAFHHWTKLQGEKKKVVRKTQTQILKNYLWTCKNACVKNHSTRCKAKLLKCLLIMLQKQHLLYSKINRCCRFQWLHYITTHSLLCFGTHYKFYHCMKELADRALEKKVKRIFTR